MSAELQTMAAAPTVGEAASEEDTQAAVQAAHPAGEAASSGKFPAKQQQNDEAQAPLDDQERRAVQKRLQRKADEKRAEKAAYASGSMSTRQPASGSMSTRTDRDLGAGARTPKGSWLSGRLTGRRTARGGSGAFGYLSSRSTAQSTVRSMMSTSRSMMTTARSDVATGRCALRPLPESRQFSSSAALGATAVQLLFPMWTDVLTRLACPDACAHEQVQRRRERRDHRDSRPRDAEPG